MRRLSKCLWQFDLGTGYDYFGEVGETDAVFLWEIADETVREILARDHERTKKGP
jgi:hypothetical protein